MQRFAPLLLALAALASLAAGPSRAAAQEPPPLVVLPVPGEGLDEATAQIALGALIAALDARVEGRAVAGVTDADAVAALVACEDDGCIGQRIAAAGGAAGVVARMRRPDAAGPLLLTLRVHDTVTGSPRGDALEASLPPEALADADAARAALGEPLGALAAALPPPPARPALLVATTQDGAEIRVDGEVVGESPLAPVELAPGRHTVTVTLDGFEPGNRSVEVGAEGARVDVELEPLPETAERMADEDAAEAAGFVDGGGGDEGPLYTRWWLWAAVGGAVLLTTIIAVAVAASGGGGGSQDGFPVPPIPGVEGM